MKKLITLMILLFTIVSYSQNNIVESYNITSVIYTENLDIEDSSTTKEINGNLIITKDNIQIKLNNELVLTLQVISNPQESFSNNREILSFTAIDQYNDLVDVVFVDYNFISIRYLNNNAIGFSFN